MRSGWALAALGPWLLCGVSLADLTITCNGKPIATGSALSPQQAARVDQARNDLEGIDSVAKGVVAGLDVGVLPKEFAAKGYDALTDGDTVLVKQEILDDLDTTWLSATFSHEADHAQYGPLGPCQHVGVTMDAAIALDQLIRRTNSAALCSWWRKALEYLDRLEKECAAENGFPTRADGSALPSWPIASFCQQ